MSIVTRDAIEPALVGYEKTWLFRVKHRGENLNLDTGTNAPFTITATAACMDTGDQDLTVTVAKYTQAGEDVGLFKATIASTVLTAAREGQWKMNIYIAASGGNAQPLDERAFTLRPVETEA